MYFHVKVVEAENVPSLDIMSKSDPMCVLTMSSSAREQRTATIKDNDNPYWNEEFRFRVADTEADTLTVAIYDSDSFTHREMIAAITLKIADFVEGEIVDQWFQMPTAKSSKKTRIKLICQLAVNGRMAFVTY